MATMIEELEKALRANLKGEFTSLTVSFNDDHAANYCTAKTYAERYGAYDEHDDWVSPEERERALDQNSVWTLHWYPDTPVGFCRLRASTLSAVVDAALAED